MNVLLLFLAFIIGVLVQRIYSARIGPLTYPQGRSWDLYRNELFRWLHRLYCECCPRRLSCEKYKEERNK